MAGLRRAPTTVMGCRPITFFLIVLLVTIVIAIFKAHIPGREAITDLISDDLSDSNVEEEDSDDPWDKVSLTEIREPPPQLPESMFGSGGIPKFYTQTLFVMHYNSRHYERMYQWRNRLHYIEHLVATVSLPDDQYWPADDPGVHQCGLPAEDGIMPYECLAQLMDDERFLAVDQPLGYMFWHFDVAVRFSHWASFNLAQFHAPKIDFIHPWNGGKAPESDDWVWWWKKNTVPQLYEDPLWKAYLPTSRYIKEGEGTEFKFFPRGFSDIYWVPTGLAGEFRNQSRIFSKNEVFAEVVAPMQCLLFGPKLCVPAAGTAFPDYPVCEIQAHPNLSWVHRTDWTDDDQLEWWDTWHLQPSVWIPAAPPAEDGVVPPYESKEPCLTKFANLAPPAAVATQG